MHNDIFKVRQTAKQFAGVIDERHVESSFYLSKHDNYKYLCLHIKYFKKRKLSTY